MRTAIVYYSMNGNTAMVAGKLAAGMDADLIELKPETAYPDKGFKKYISGGGIWPDCHWIPGMGRERHTAYPNFCAREPGCAERKIHLSFCLPERNRRRESIQETAALSRPGYVCGDNDPERPKGQAQS